MTTASMSRTTTSDWQRTARIGLTLDGTASGAVGLLLIVAAAALDDRLGISSGILIALGVLLVLWGVALGTILRRPLVPLNALRSVAIFNVVWVLGSAVVDSIGWDGRTGQGRAFLIFVAACAGLFSVIQFTALRQAARGDA